MCLLVAIADDDAAERYPQLCGVATISRLLKIIGLFCRRALSKRRFSAIETDNLKEPINRSHPIVSWTEKKERDHRKITKKKREITERSRTKRERSQQTSGKNARERLSMYSHLFC